MTRLVGHKTVCSRWPTRRLKLILYWERKKHTMKMIPHTVLVEKKRTFLFQVVEHLGMQNSPACIGCMSIEKKYLDMDYIKCYERYAVKINAFHCSMGMRLDVGWPHSHSSYNYFSHLQYLVCNICLNLDILSCFLGEFIHDICIDYPAPGIPVEPVRPVYHLHYCKVCWCRCRFWRVRLYA